MSALRGRTDILPKRGWFRFWTQSGYSAPLDPAPPTEAAELVRRYSVNVFGFLVLSPQPFFSYSLPNVSRSRIACTFRLPQTLLRVLVEFLYQSHLEFLFQNPVEFLYQGHGMNSACRRPDIGSIRGRQEQF
jgi:hypothetical protein